MQQFVLSGPLGRPLDKGAAVGIIPWIMTAREAFDAVSNGGLKDLETALAICRRHGGYCVIGGLAVNTYVRPVYTMVADIVIASNQLSLVAAELVAAGFTVHEETWSLNAQQTGSDLRIQFTKDPRYQAFLSAAVPAKVLGCDAMVASLRDLVASKILAWSDPGRRLSKRKKDEADLIRLAEDHPEVLSLLPEELRRQFGGGFPTAASDPGATPGADPSS